MPRVKINGREVLIPDSVTDTKIREEGNVRPGRTLIRRTKEGNHLIPKGSRVVPREGDVFIDAPARTKGLRAT